MPVDIEHFEALCRTQLVIPRENGEGANPAEVLATLGQDLAAELREARERIAELEEQAEVGRLMERLPIAYHIDKAALSWYVLDMHMLVVAHEKRLVDALRIALEKVDAKLREALEEDTGL